MTSQDRFIPAAQFKAKCLQIMDEVNRLHTEVVITKHGQPVAKLVPYEKTQPKLFGKLEGSLHICGDVLAPIDEVWDA